MEYIGGLIDLAKNNQFLVGGVATVLLSGVMYTIRSLPRRIFLWLRRSCSIEFTITTRNEQYEQFVRYLERVRIQFFSRNYTVSQYAANVVPGYGLSFGWFQGCLLVFQRQMLEGRGDRINEQISVALFTRKREVLKAFVKAATTVPDKYKNYIQMYYSSSTDWRSSGYKHKRALASVFTSGTVKEELINKITWFKANEQWYVERGIPYKFCFCLYGTPGTGKTSLLRAVASHFNSRVRYVNSLSNIDALVSNCDDGDLVIVEDIDTLAKLDRKKETKPSDENPLVAQPGQPTAAESLEELFGVNVLHKVLNALDGFQSSHGMIVGITTNHLTELDPALRRVGRIDFLAELGPLEQDKMESMFACFYPGQEAQDLLATYLDQFSYQPVVGARLQELFSSPTPEEAIEGLQALEHRPAFQIITGDKKSSANPL